MRRFPISWDKTLTSLGFRRKVKRVRRDRYGRKTSRLEQLEVRAMLSASPYEVVNDTTAAVVSDAIAAQKLPLAPIRAEYVLADSAAGDTPDQFEITTEYGDGGTPTAVIRLKEGLEWVDKSLQELTVELRLGEAVLARHEVLIDIAEANFVYDFQRAREAEFAAEAEAAEPVKEETFQLWLGSIDADGRFTAEVDSLEIASRLNSPEDWLHGPFTDREVPKVSKVPEPTSVLDRVVALGRTLDTTDLFASDSDKASFYLALEQSVADAPKRGVSADLEAVEKSEKIANELAVRLGHQIARDLESDDAEVAIAATKARAELLQSADPSYTVLSGLKVNHRLASNDNESGQTSYSLNIVEEGSISIDDAIRVELGDYEAMVQTRSEWGRSSSTTPRFASLLADVGTLQDATIDALVPTANDNGNALLIGQLGGAGAFVESGGLVAFEAENYHGKVVGTTDDWTIENDQTGYSGTGFVFAGPDDGTLYGTSPGYLNGSPRLDYQVEFASAGTYHVWVRGMKTNGSNDSVHVGLNGQANTTADRIQVLGTGFSWNHGRIGGGIATVVVPSAGVHTVNIWMREDGVRIDKLVLTDDANYTPSGTGPSESATSGAATSDTTALLGFDLSQYAGSVPQSATLVLDTESTSGTGTDISVSAHNDLWNTSETAGWDESTVTWDEYATDLQAGFGGVLDTQTATSGTTLSLDVTETVQRALLLGDSNFNSDLDWRGAAGDVEAFYLAATDYAAYTAKYAGLEQTSVADGFLYRNDANVDGVVDSADVTPYLQRMGIARGDFNLDGTVDGKDYAVWSANFGATADRFGMGDANADTYVNAVDFTVWRDSFGETVEAFTSPEATFQLVAAAGSSAAFASGESTSGTAPKLEVDLAARTVVQSFDTTGGDLRVTYENQHESPIAPTLAIYQVVDGVMTPLASGVGLSTALGVHQAIVTAPAPITNPGEAYTLIAEVETSGVPTTWRDFDGGVFETSDGKVHAHGTAADDTISYDEGVFSVSNASGFTADHAVGSTGGGAYVESGGLIAFEAENYHAKLVGATDDWTVESDQTGHTGDGFVYAGPDDGTLYGTSPGYLNGSPRLDYQVEFASPGTYYVWVRGMKADAGSDSVHVGLDGQANTTADRVQVLGTGFNWNRNRVGGGIATLVVPSAGVHTVNIWMREDGVRIDKLVVTDDANFTPTGNGPAVSAGGPSSGTPFTGEAYLHGLEGADTLAIEQHTGASIMLVGGHGDDVYDVSADVQQNSYVELSDESGLDEVKLTNWGAQGADKSMFDPQSTEVQMLELAAAESPYLEFRFARATAELVTELTDRQIFRPPGRPSSVLTVSNLSDVIDDRYQDPEIDPLSDGLSLREALKLSAESNFYYSEIQFDDSLFESGKATINLTYASGSTNNTLPEPFWVSGPVQINGPGADLLAVDGTSPAYLSSVFHVDGYSQQGQAFDAGISGLEISGGDYAGINAEITQLSLSGLRVRGNYNGVVNTITQSVITNSAIHDNTNTGILGDPAELAISNTTIANNGGYGVAVSESGSLSIDHATIVENGSYGVLLAGYDEDPYDVTLNNSIVAGNGTQQGSGPWDIAASTGIEPTGTNNVLVNGGASGDTQQLLNTIVLNSAAQAVLMPFGDHGGTTPTYALSFGSPAQDAGTASALVIDQRGLDRDATPDIGAYEINGHVVTSAADDDGADGLTLRQAIAKANRGEVIFFAPELNSETIVLGSESDLIIDKSLTIDATDLPDGITLRAYDPTPWGVPADATTPYISHDALADGGRLFKITGEETEVTLRGMTLTGGDTWDDGGAINAQGKSLTLEQMTIAHNAAPRLPHYEVIGRTGFIDYEHPDNSKRILGDFLPPASGGGVYSTGDLVVRDSTFINNATGGDALEPPTFNDVLGGVPAGGNQFDETIFAGDIYAIGDFTIEDSRFLTETVATGEGVPLGIDGTYAVGGVYAINQRPDQPITVAVNDTEFFQTRGLAVDHKGFDDPSTTEYAYPKVIGYEFANVVGGKFFVSDSLPAETIDAPDDDEEAVFAIDIDDLSELYFRDDPEIDGEEVTPFFEARPVYASGDPTPWLTFSFVESAVDDGEPPAFSSGSVTVSDGGYFRVEGFEGLVNIAEESYRNTVVIDGLTMENMRATTKLWTHYDPTEEEILDGEYDFIQDHYADLLFYYANVSVNGLTWYANNLTDFGLDAWNSNLVINESRFLGGEWGGSTLHILDGTRGRGTGVIDARGGDTTVRNTVFNALHLHQVMSVSSAHDVLIEDTTFANNSVNVVLLAGYDDTTELPTDDLPRTDGSLTIRGSQFRDNTTSFWAAGGGVHNHFANNVGGIIDVNVSDARTKPDPSQEIVDEVLERAFGPDPLPLSRFSTLYEEAAGNPRHNFSYTNLDLLLSDPGLQDDLTIQGMQEHLEELLEEDTEEDPRPDERAPYPVLISDVVVSDNEVTRWQVGDSGFLRTGNVNGGAVALLGPIDAVIENSAIVSNTVRTDRIDGRSDLAYGGGILAANATSLVVNGSTVADNYTSGDGGGIYVEDVDRVEIANSTIAQNVAGGQGGGIFATAVPDMIGRTQYGDTTIDAAVGRSGFLTLTNTIVAGNIAEGGVNVDKGYSHSSGEERYHSERPRYTTDLFIGSTAHHAVHTTDLWVAPTSRAPDELPLFGEDFSFISPESRNNVIGVATDPNKLLPDDATPGVGPEADWAVLPLVDGDNGNRVGTPDQPLLLDLGPLGDYGNGMPTIPIGAPGLNAPNPNDLTAYLADDAYVDLIDAGYRNHPTGAPEDELLKPAHVWSSTRRVNGVDGSPENDAGADRWRAQNLLSSPVTLGDGDALPPANYLIEANRFWSTAQPDLTLPAPTLSAPELTFDFSEEREVSKLFLWDGPSDANRPREVAIAYWNQETLQFEGEEIVTLGLPTDGPLADVEGTTAWEYDLDDDGNRTGARATVDLSSHDLAVGGYVKTSRVRVTVTAVYGVGSGGAPDRRVIEAGQPAVYDVSGDANTEELVSAWVSLDEVRFAAKETGADQRGNGFDRVVGETIDIGAYEAPAEWLSLPTTHRPDLPELPDGTHDYLVVTTAEDLVDEFVVTQASPPGESRDLSLREAVLLSNTHSGVQGIVVDAAVLGTDRLVLEQGELLVTDSVEFVSAGLAPGEHFAIDASGSYEALPTVEDPLYPDLPGRADLYTQPERSHAFIRSGESDVDWSRHFRLDDGRDDHQIDVSITGFELSGGLVDDSGGSIWSSENLTIQDSRLRDNHAHQSRMTRHLPHAAFPDRNGDGYDNEARKGGAIYSESGDLKVTSSVFQENSAAAMGGAIHVEGGGFLLSKSVVSGNVVRLVDDFLELPIEHEMGEGHHVDEAGADIARGGGISLVDVHAVATPDEGDDKTALPARIESSTIDGNTAVRVWSAERSPSSAVMLTREDFASYGGGLYVQESWVELDGVTVSDNEAGVGGGVFVLGQNIEPANFPTEDPSPDALAPVAETSTLTLQSSTVSGNRARVHAIAYTGEIDTSDHAPEAPSGGGVAIYGGAHLAVSHSTVTDNAAMGGDGVDDTEVKGGGIYTQGESNYVTTLDIDHSIVAGNWAPSRFEYEEFNTNVKSGRPAVSSAYLNADDIHHATVLAVTPSSPEADFAEFREEVWIENSLIGDNRRLVARVNDSGEPLDRYGYTQSTYVNPTDGVTPLAWEAGGILKPDDYGNYIGGGLIGRGYDLSATTRPRVEGYFGGFLNPHLDALADNGGPGLPDGWTPQTHLPLTSVEPVALVRPEIDSVVYTGHPSEGGLSKDADIVRDPIVGYHANSGLSGLNDADVLTLPFTGNEALLTQDIRKESWRTTPRGGSGTDFFANADASDVPTFTFDLGGDVRLTEAVVWSQLEPTFPEPFEPWSSIQGDAARELRLTYYLDGGMVGSETLHRTLPTAEGISERLPLSVPVEADKVVVALTDNFYGEPGVNGGGDRVALGQIRFVGELLNGFGKEPGETWVSPAINAGDDAISDAPSEDQRGAGYARVIDGVIDGVIDIGAVESGSGVGGAITLGFANQMTTLVDGQSTEGGLRVADLVVSGHTTAPLDFTLPADSPFQIGIDEHGHQLRELWIKPGAEIDYESLYDTQGTVLSVDVSVTERSTGASSSVVPLSIPVVDANDRPELVGEAPPLTLPRDVTPETNDGVLVAALIGSATDDDTNTAVHGANADELGIAIVGTDVGGLRQSPIEYSLDDGATWTEIVGVSAARPLLLPRDARLRLNLREPFSDTIDDAITFRVWDGTKGLAGESYFVHEVESSLSLPPDGADGHSVDIVVTPQAGGPIDVAANAVAGSQTDVAIDGRGVILHVWREAGGIKLAREGGSAITVTQSTSATTPRVVALPDGDAVVTWLDNGEIWAKRYDLETGGFAVTPGSERIESGVVEFSGVELGINGELVATWRDGNGWQATRFSDSLAPSTAHPVAASAASVAVAGPAANGEMQAAWVDGSSVYAGQVGETTPPAVATVSTGATADDVRLVVVDDVRVVAWRETEDDAAGIGHRVRVVRIDEANNATELTVASPAGGTRITGLDLAVDAAGRVGLAWTETGVSTPDASRLQTLWLDSAMPFDGTEDGGDSPFVFKPTPFSQAVVGGWSMPSFAADAAGRFVVAAPVAGSGPTRITAQRFELTDVNPVSQRLTHDGGDVTFAAGTDDGVTFRPTIQSYGGTDYLSINGRLTDVNAGDLDSGVVFAGAGGADRFDLSGFAFGETIYIDGGAGNDEYVLSADHALDVVVRDAAGSDTLQLDGWGSVPQTVVLGYHGVQSFAAGGGTTELRLEGDIESVVPEGAHEVFSAANKPSSLVVETNADSVHIDDGQTSLREALLWAQVDEAADEITFDLGLGTINLTLGELVVGSAVTIDGGDGGQAIAAAPNSRLFRVEAGTGATLRKLTLRDGDAAASDHSGDGGAILAHGDLTLSNVTIEDAVAAGDGGGVAFFGETLRVQNSSFEGNGAVRGGGVYVGGGDATIDRTVFVGNGVGTVTQGGVIAVGSNGSLALSTSTVSGNKATVSGGGVYVEDGAGAVSIKRTTLADNESPTGAGLYTERSGVVVAASLFARNEDSTGVSQNIGRTGAGAIDGPNSKHNYADSAVVNGLDAASNELGGSPNAISSQPVNGVYELTGSLSGEAVFTNAEANSAGISIADQLGKVPAVGDDLNAGAYQFNGADDNGAHSVPSYAVNIDENSPSGAILRDFTIGANAAGDLVAADPPWRTYHYAIVSGDPFGAFAIDRDTGVLSVANSSALDHETTQTVDLIIEALWVDQNVAETGVVRVTIEDIDEGPEFGRSSYGFELEGAITNGLTIGFVSATDPEGAAVTYTVSSDTGAGPDAGIAIDSDGRLFVNNASKLERNESYDFEVRATSDSGDGNKSVTIGGRIDVSPAPEPIDPPATPIVLPPTDYSVSHTGSMRFNPLAGVDAPAGVGYTVDFGGGDQLKYHPTTGWSVHGGGTVDLRYGELTLHGDGSATYDPHDDADNEPDKHLVNNGKLTERGPNGAYYYIDELIDFTILRGDSPIETEHELTVRVTNSLPVLRGEYAAGSNGVATLGDAPFRVLRDTSYVIDTADLFYDADGDPIEVLEITNTSETLDYSRYNLRYASGISAPPRDEESSDSRLAAGFGYTETNGEAVAIRYVTVEKTSDSVLVVHHDGKQSDTATNSTGSVQSEFRTLGNDSRRFEIRVGDSRQEDVQAGGVFSFEVGPQNGSAMPSDNAHHAWVDIVKQTRDDDLYLPGSDAEPADLRKLNAVDWTVGASDYTPRRGETGTQRVGDTDVNLVTGAVQRRHGLVLDGSGGASDLALPGLVYDAAVAEPRPVVEATLRAPDLPDVTGGYNVTAVFTWYDHANPKSDGPARESVPVTLTGVDDTELEAGLRFAFEPDAAPIVSGLYGWDVEFTIEVENTAAPDDVETLTIQHSGETPVVVHRPVATSESEASGAHAPAVATQSPQFGAGWALEGVPHLFVDDIRGRESLGGEADQGDDRLILWFPGEVPRVFAGNAALTSGQLERHAYETEGDAGGPVEFTPIDPDTGLRDPLEYGKLTSYSSKQYSWEDGTPAIYYTDAEGVVYKFEKAPESVPSGNDTNFDPKPVWRLASIGHPSTPNSVEFTYHDGSHEDALRIDTITATDGTVISFEDNASEFDVDRDGDNFATLKLNGGNLTEIKHDEPNTSANDPTREFAYETNSHLLKSDEWNGANGDNGRHTLFKHQGSVLTAVWYGVSGTNDTTPDTAYEVESVVPSAAINGLVAATDRVATVKLATDDTPGDSVNEYTFDANAQVVTQIDSFDPSGSAGPTVLNRTEWTRDQLGSVIEAKEVGDPGGAGEIVRHTYFQYDYQTPPTYLQASDPQGPDTVPRYDLDDYRGNVTRIDDYGGTTRFEYETDDELQAAVGALTLVVAPTGVRTEQAWTKQRLLVSRTVTNGNQQLSSEAREYHHLDDPSQPDFALLAKYTDPLKLETTYAYDAARRVQTVTTKDLGLDGAIGGGDDETIVTTYAYDANGFVDLATETVGSSTISHTDYDHDTRGLLTQLRVYDKDGGAKRFEESYAYAADGLLRTVTDGNGAVTTNTYDKRGLLTRTTVEHATLSEDHLTSHSYYTDGTLKTTTLSNGETVTESYDPIAREFEIRTTGVAETTDWVGGSVDSNTTTATVTTTFDALGRAISVEDALTGAETASVYHDLRHDAPTLITELVNLGDTKKPIETRLAYDRRGAVTFEQTAHLPPTRYHYDAFGRLVQSQVMSDHGAVYAYTHDAAGNVLTETETRRAPGTEPQKYRTAYAYDQSGRLRSVTDPGDGEVNVDGTGVTPRTATTAYGFVDTSSDTVQRLVTTTSRDGIVTSATFDAAGNLVAETNAYGGEVVHTYDQAGNRTLTTEVDPLGDGANRLTEYEYDGLGRVTRVLQHGAADDGEANALITETEYRTSGVWDVTVIDAQGATLRQAFDSRGQLIASRHGGSATASDDHVVLNSYAYDDAEGVTTVTTRSTSPRAEADLAAHDETVVTLNAYNTAGDRLLHSVSSVEGPNSAFQVREANAYELPGLLSVTVNGAGDETTFTYDLGGSGLPLVKERSRPGQTVRYEYDSAGNRLSQEVNDADRLDWAYDAFGRMTEERTKVDLSSTNPGQAVTRKWDYEGLVTTYTDRNGVSTRDELVLAAGAIDRMTTTVTGAGYDYTAHQDYHADGRLQRAADAWQAGWNGTVPPTGDHSSVAYTYDEHGRVATETSDHEFHGVAAPTTVVTVGGYHDNGVRETATIAIGTTNVAYYTYGIDSRGRVQGLSQVFDPQADWSSTAAPSPNGALFAYNADGRRSGVFRFATGLGDLDAQGAFTTPTTLAIGETAYAYHPTGGVETITHEASGASAPLAIHDYRYDEAGRIEAIGTVYRDAAGTNVLYDSRHTNLYNGRGELEGTAADGDQAPSTDDPNDENYTRDANGNLTANVGAHSRLLTSTTESGAPLSHTYDGEGRQTRVESTAGGTRSYAWDHRGLLRSADAEGASGLLPHDVEFFYDVLGRKVARRSHNAGGVAEEHTVYHYDGADLAFETDALDGDKITRGYFNGPGVNEVLAIDEALAGDVETVWQLPDHAGTSKSVARQAGGMWKVEHRVMTAAGEVLDKHGDTTDQALIEAPTIFAGHQYDADLELYDAKARWLDPTNQRFLSEDPLGDAGGSTNLYVYAGGDPVNYIDPDGRAIFTTAALVTAGGYLLTQAGFGAAETGVEYAGTRALGSQQDIDDFSFLATFGKNFAINVATFGLGGKAKAGTTAARIAGKYALRQGVEIAGETAFDVYNGRGLGESLAYNTAGSLLGEAAGRAIGSGARAFHRNFEVTLDTSGVYVGSGVGGAGSLSVQRRLFRGISSQGLTIFDGGLDNRRNFELLRGANLDPPRNFDGIDRINRSLRIGTSNKTLDLRSKFAAHPAEFQRVVRGYVESLREFDGPFTKAGVSIPALRSRRLELGVQADMLTDVQRNILRSEALRASRLARNPVVVTVFEIADNG